MFKGFNFKKIGPAAGIGAHELVGIDLSGRYIRLAHALAAHGKTEIVNLLEKDAGPSEEDLIKNIALAFKELQPKKPTVINIIPAQYVITKNIEIPSTNSNEIKKIVNLQANRHTPYSREEIMVDYIDLGVYKHSYTKILLIIVTRDIIKKHFEILNKAGIKVEKMVLAQEALALAGQRLFKLEAGEFPANIVNIDKEFTEFTIIHKNKLLFMRSIPVGAQHLITGEEKHKIRFADEIRKSFEVYQSEKIEKNPERILLTGVVDEFKDLELALAETLHLPVLKTAYAKELRIPDAVVKILSGSKASFLNVIAPLIFYNETKINLVPEEVRIRRAIEERGRDLVKTGILTLALLALIFCILVSNICFKESYLKNLDLKYRKLNGETQDLEKKFTKIEVVKNFLSTRGYSLISLVELYDVMPPDTELNYIRFENDKISLGGTAESMSTVFAFVTNMEDSQYFKEVQTKQTSKRKDGLKDVTDFELVAILTK